jgi:flagellar assembly factor FliW
VKVETTRFGELEIAAEDVLTFTNGIPGLVEYKKFVLLPADSEAETPFFFLQSIENKGLSLFLVNPFQMFKDYDVELDEKTIESLKITNEADVLLFTIITVNNTLQDSTTNLKAPIVINVKEKLGTQMILDHKKFLIRQPLSV